MMVYDVYLHQGDNRAAFLGTYEGSKAAVLEQLEEAGYDIEPVVPNGRHYGECRLDPVVDA